MFKRFLRSPEVEIPDNDPVAGQKLFELGMAHATRFRTTEAIKYYTRSIAANPDPAPYLNRANLLRHRLRFEEALTDLQKAERLDQAGYQLFADTLDVEIAQIETILTALGPTARESLRQDLIHQGPDHVARRILSVSFGCAPADWDRRTPVVPLLQFHFFNELDNILKFEDASAYPELRSTINDLQPGMIDHAIEHCPDAARYEAAEMQVHAFLACHDMPDRRRLRTAMLCALQDRILPQMGKEGQIPATTRRQGVADRLLDDLMPASRPPEMRRIGGIDMPLTGVSDQHRSAFADQALVEIVKRAPSDYETYRYLMEECERFSDGPFAHFILTSRHSFFPLEYEGSAESAPRNQPYRAALRYLDDEVMPGLVEVMGERSAEELRLLVFQLFCQQHRDRVIALRLAHAVHYHNTCIAKGHFTYADRWAEVIDWLETA